VKGKPATRKRRVNKGWFARGFDPRRTYKFTRQDCRKGFRVTVCKYPHLLDWVMGRFLTGRDARRRAEAEIPF
jgi:hypothetical protein